MPTAKVEFYPEVCCDECGDVRHNHIDCPACGQHYAATDVYCGLWEQDDGKLTCQECDQEFKFELKGAALFLTW